MKEEGNRRMQEDTRGLERGENARCEAGVINKGRGKRGKREKKGKRMRAWREEGRESVQ